MISANELGASKVSLILFTVLFVGIGAWFLLLRVSPWPPMEGKPYPKNATFLDTQGRTLRMPAFKGKYVVIHYVRPASPADIGNATFTMGRQFDGRVEGVSSTDPRVVWLEILIMNEQNGPPSAADHVQWDNKMKNLRQGPAPMVLRVSPRLTSQRHWPTTQALGGTQLLDRQGIVRVDVTGSHPKNWYWSSIVERLGYWLQSSTDDEPPPTPAIKPEFTSDVLSEEDRSPSN